MRSRKGYVQGTSLHKQGIEEKLKKESSHKFLGGLFGGGGGGGGGGLGLRNILDPAGIFGGGGLFGKRNR